MNPIKQKAPGSTPRPSKTRETASAVPRPNELVNSGTATAGEQVNRPEAFYLASLAYGEVVEASVSRAQTEPEAAFELIDHYTLDLMLKAGLAEQVSLYLLLSEYSSYEEKHGSIRYYTVTRAELAKRLGKAESTVSRWLSKLEAHGFISTYYQRQTESPGISRVAGNAYVLEHRQLRGKLTGAAIYQEPLVETANTEPMTQSTEAEVRVSLDPSLGVSLPTDIKAQRAVLRSIRLMNSPGVNAPSSSTATSTNTTSYSNLTTPLVKNDELVITYRDLDRDLIKPHGKKRKPISDGQRGALEAIWRRLRLDVDKAESELLLKEGALSLSDISQSRANEIIQELNASINERESRYEQPMLSVDEVMRRKGIAPIGSRLSFEEEDKYADELWKREEERYYAEQHSLYGRLLTEAEETGRSNLTKALVRHNAEPALRARGKKLRELEHLFVITPEARLSSVLELING